MRAALAALAIACLALSACRTPAAPPVDSPVLRGVRFAPLVPDAADHAAADLLVAALASRPDPAARALERIEDIDARNARDGEPATGLAAAAGDLYNAAFLDPRAYREAAEELLERDDLSDALRGRLVWTSRDDPLELADARIRDAYLTSFSRLFNALSEPAGRSVMNMAVAPYRLGQSLVLYAIDVYRDDPLPLQRRQALAHWKEFLERYPEAPESPEVASRAQRAQVRWHRTQRDRALREARKALRAKRPREAHYYAERALRHDPDDADAEEIRRRSVRELALQRERRDASLDVEILPVSTDPLPPGSRQLALALFAEDGDALAAARAVPAHSPLSDEARFVEAMARGEAGDAEGMWRGMRELARDAGPAMRRHAAAELADPQYNPYDAFVRARRHDRWSTATWVMLGPGRLLPAPGIDGAAEWLVGLPNRVQTAVLLPVRLLGLYRSRPAPSARATALHARRYLMRRPDGAQAEEVRAWLEEYERSRENWIGALRVAEEREPRRDDELEALRERAARQALEVATHEERRDLRSAMLHNVAREFSDTRAGREAGSRAREELEKLTPHRIRISRGFLEENPDVAGPGGLGLDPLLLDGDPSNGELHPEGVALVGGRRLEFSFVAANADEDDPPEKIVTTLSEEHLGRLVARLEEASFRNAMADEDDALEPNAQRDLVFERARLGLADEVDTRATAEARYAYRGMRERYGMVRSRPGILPFDIVVQGSLSDLSLGAFPRMRTPRETPDAILYR
ncbi:MAG TPA: hypothetical protein VIY27_09545 [Myxococcota bacterium]